jgi:hypothetical protein
MNLKLLSDQYQSIINFFANADSSIRGKNFDSAVLMIFNGILRASSHSQSKAVKFLMGTIDVSMENNLLLNTAVHVENMELVRILLKDERVINAGLDHAMELSKSPSMFNLLYRKSMVRSE